MPVQQSRDHTRGLLLPHYFFYVRTAHGTLINDNKGVHLPDIEVALDEASRAARALSEDAGVNGYDASGSYFEIVSSDGRERIVMPIDVALKPREGGAAASPLRFARTFSCYLSSYCWRGLAVLKVVKAIASQGPLGRGP
jgi:hypothetical protein